MINDLHRNTIFVLSNSLRPFTGVYFRFKHRTCATVTSIVYTTPACARLKETFDRDV